MENRICVNHRDRSTMWMNLNTKLMHLRHWLQAKQSWSKQLSGPELCGPELLRGQTWTWLYRSADHIPSIWHCLCHLLSVPRAAPSELLWLSMSGQVLSSTVGQQSGQNIWVFLSLLHWLQNNAVKYCSFLCKRGDFFHQELPQQWEQTPSAPASGSEEENCPVLSGKQPLAVGIQVLHRSRGLERRALGA